MVLHTQFRIKFKRIPLAITLSIASALPCVVHTVQAEPISPIPLAIEVDKNKVALGRKLFHDTRLSKDNSISCATCHDLANGGDDGKPVSMGVKNAMGLINTPTVFNSAYNFKHFWNGRASSLEEQVDAPVQASNEMDEIWPRVIAKLYKDSAYPAEFEKTFNDKITREHIKASIAEFQRSLITPNSRFDQYLRGNHQAMNQQELQGYQAFKDYGCISCHQGMNVGGNMFQVFGVINSYFKHRGTELTDADKGRYTVTGRKEDMHMFKVPSLRMVAHTAPYFHDGSQATLRDAVDAMFKFQLGREAPDQDKDAIVAFLKTLAGQYPGAPKP